MALTRTDRFRQARSYTVVERGRGWLLAVSWHGTVVLRTAPGAATRVAAAAALIRLANAKAAASARYEGEGPVEDLGWVYLDEQPPASPEELDRLSFQEFVESLEEAPVGEETPR